MSFVLLTGRGSKPLPAGHWARRGVQRDPLALREDRFNVRLNLCRRPLRVLRSQHGGPLAEPLDADGAVWALDPDALAEVAGEARLDKMAL